MKYIVPIKRSKEYGENRPISVGNQSSTGTQLKETTRRRTRFFLTGSFLLIIQRQSLRQPKATIRGGEIFLSNMNLPKAGFDVARVAAARRKCDQRYGEYFSCDMTVPVNGNVTQGQTKTSRETRRAEMTCLNACLQRHVAGVAQDAAPRQAGLQNGNPQDYCTYKRFTVRGPFARAKGRPRSLWQQTGGSQHLPFYFPGCKPPAPRRLSLSLRQVILLHRPAVTTPSPPPLPSPSRLSFPFFSPYSPSPVFLRSVFASSRVVSSSALEILKHRHEPPPPPPRSVIPSVAVLSIPRRNFRRTKGPNATHCRVLRARYPYRSIVRVGSLAGTLENMKARESSVIFCNDCVSPV